MTDDDFRKSPAYPGEIDFWHSVSTVHSALGDFQVFLEMSEDGDHAPPDDQMIERANRLITFFKQNEKIVQQIVFGAYLSICRTDPRELKLSNVPVGLSPEGLKSYIAGKKLIVSRHLSSEANPYSCRIIVVPDWDQEHALNMNISGERITEINGYSFEFKNGELNLV